jgi:hypothetical protein
MLRFVPWLAFFAAIAPPMPFCDLKTKDPGFARPALCLQSMAVGFSCNRQFCEQSKEHSFHSFVYFVIKLALV